MAADIGHRGAHGQERVAGGVGTLVVGVAIDMPTPFLMRIDADMGREDAAHQFCYASHLV